MKLILTAFAFALECFAVILMTIGLIHGVSGNPGAWIFGIGAVLAMTGGILFTKVIRFLKEG